MVLHEMGFPSISFNAEGVGTGDIPFIEETIHNLKKRFEHVILLYDNDDAGRKYSYKMGGKFRLKSIFLTRCKDISDEVYKYGKRSAFRALKKIISKQFKQDVCTPF